jgi:hypothetical protein
MLMMRRLELFSMLSKLKGVSIGAKGPAVKALWSMPEFAHQEFDILEGQHPQGNL